MVVVCIFCFFKTKTAYEMRISDWSSDVCSSDLRAKHGIRRDRHGHDYVAGNDAETKALQAEIRALKDRIQVLERIATDNNRAVTLDQEIEKLRDSSKS